MQKLFVLIGCIIGLSLAQTPYPPQWPFGFSATVVFTNGTQPPQIMRWFYDYVLQSQRVDQVIKVGNDVSIFVNVYLDYSNKIQYNVEYIENTVSCQIQVLDESLVLPTFNGFSFMGPNLVGYTQAYAWNQKGSDSVFRVWDRIEDRVIIRWEELHSNQPKLKYELWEMDPNPQDPSLFLVPETIAKMCEGTATINK